MAITLDPVYVADASFDTYTVGETADNTINTARFNRFLAKISHPKYGRLTKDRLIDANGNLEDGAEILAALLICDLIAIGPVTDLGIKSEDFGGAYSYTKSEAAASTTKSAFMVRYETELTELRTGHYASKGQARSDYQIEFAKLSQGDYPTVSDSSSNYPTM